MNRASVAVPTLLTRYVAFSERRPFTVLAVALVLAIVGGLLGRTLKVDPRLEALLPDDTPAQLDAREARARFAGLAPYYLVVQSSNPALNRAIAEKALAAVRDWKETLWAIDRRDGSYFLDRRLLYLDAPSLEETAEELEFYLDWQRCSRMPGCVNLEDEPPTPDLEKLGRRYRELPELRALMSLFGSDAPAPEPSQAEAAPEGSGQDRLEGRLCAKDGSVCVVQAALEGDAGDLDYASRMLRRGEALLESLRPADAPSDLLLAVTGMYRNLPLSRDAVLEDLGKTFGVGLALILLVLVVQFRGMRALVLLTVPLLVGLAWTAGLVALVSPTLDVISSAVLVVLAGLGIDFGLHLLTHFGAHRAEGRGVTASVEQTLASLAGPLLLATATTACGFLALTFAEFRGFVQMGALSALGISVVLVASIVLFPAMIFAGQRLAPRETPLTRAIPIPAFLTRPFRPRHATWVAVSGLALFVASAIYARGAELEHRFDKMQPTTTAHGTNFGAALHGESRSSVLLLADTPAHLEEAAAELRRLYPDGLRGDGNGAIITPGLFMPADQDRRLAAIGRLRTLADDASRFATGDLAAQIDAWRPHLAQASKVSQNELPPWVVESLSERNGRFGTIGTMYASYAGSDAHQMTELSEKLKELRRRFPHVRFASAPAILGEVVPLLRADGFRVTILALVGLCLGTFLLSRSLLRTLLVVVPVVLAVTCTAALMVLFGWKINLYNMLVFPVAFGIGIDGAIYVVSSALGRTGRSLDWDEYPTTVRAILGATLTSMAGFGCLMISENPGLASLGFVAVLALGLTLVVNLGILPALLVLFAGSKPRT